MKVFNIDPEILKSVTTSAKAASNGIGEACSYLDRVSQHYDWDCSEKNRINSNAVDNKKIANTIRENMSSFLNEITKVYTEIIETEDRLPSMWTGVSENIADVLRECVEISESNEIAWKSTVSRISNIVKPTVNLPGNIGQNGIASKVANSAIVDFIKM